MLLDRCPWYIAGSMLFALEWMVAGTCPGPVAAMIGEGRLIGLAVVAGLLAGVRLQPVLVGTAKLQQHAPAPAAAGLYARRA